MADRRSWVSRTRSAANVFWVVAACGSPSRASHPLRLETSAAGADTRLTILADAGLKLNARLQPALELSDGRVIRFGSPHLTADSAYFTAPPSAVLAGRHARVRGKLRASVCDSAETVCRTVVEDL